eukprot:120924-Alexandrium_andersonii.AAC.1
MVRGRPQRNSELAREQRNGDSKRPPVCQAIARKLAGNHRGRGKPVGLRGSREKLVPNLAREPGALMPT